MNVFYTRAYCYKFIHIFIKPIIWIFFNDNIYVTCYNESCTSKLLPISHNLQYKFTFFNVFYRSRNFLKSIWNFVRYWFSFIQTRFISLPINVWTKFISNSNNLIFYFRYSFYPSFTVSYMRISFTERLIVSRTSSHLSTVAITMSVRKSDLVRSTSVWSLRPNEIFHRPNQHTSSVFVPWRRRRNISLWHKDAPLKKVVWYRTRIHNFCNWKRSFRIPFPLLAQCFYPPRSRVTFSPLSSPFSRITKNASTLYRFA